MDEWGGDSRVVWTLDAGGTHFRFFAMQRGAPIGEGVVLPSEGDDLSRCLSNLVEGFTRIQSSCPAPPVAISFAFPGPADYRAGVIGDLGNLPAFRGGVPLGPMLEDRFGIPVFIHNDGDLFAYGEALGGFLPQVNRRLKEAGSPKRFKNLLGVTFGTGFGGGIVRDGEPLLGDNSMAAEIWLSRDKKSPERNAEESVSIRGVRRFYSERAGVPLELVPEPKEIFDIGMGCAQGDRDAAREAFRRMGEAAGEAMANALTLVDGLAVIGGGLSGAWPLFLPALMEELNGSYSAPGGSRFRRLTPEAFNLEDPSQLQEFLRPSVRKLAVPGSGRSVAYEPRPRIGVGLSRLGTSQAVALGAYVSALRRRT